MTTKISQQVRIAATPLGKAIIGLADIANLSVPDVAQIIGIDPLTIYRAICDPLWAPKPKTYTKLQAFGVPEIQLDPRGLADENRRRGWHPCRGCGKAVRARRSYCSKTCFDDQWRVALPPKAFKDPLRKKVAAAINASGLKVYPWAEQQGLHAQNLANWLRDPERRLSRRNLARLAAPLGISEEETISLAGGTVEEWRAKRIQELRMPPPKLRRHLKRIGQIPRSEAANEANRMRRKGKPAPPGAVAAVLRDSRSVSGRLRRMLVAYKVNHGHYPNGDTLDEYAARANDRYTVGDVATVKSQMQQIIARLSTGRDRRSRKPYYDHLEICKRRRAGEGWAIIARSVLGDATQAENVRPAHALWHSRKKMTPCQTPA